MEGGNESMFENGELMLDHSRQIWNSRQRSNHKYSFWSHQLDRAERTWILGNEMKKDRIYEHQVLGESIELNTEKKWWVNQGKMVS